MTKTELLELLKKARKQLKKYHVPKDEQTVRLSIDTLENALTEQPEIVRCKDCKHYEPDEYCPGFGDCTGACDNLVKVHADWFCADGERKKEDE